MASPTVAGTPTTANGNGTSASLTKIAGLANGDSVVLIVAQSSITSPTITWPSGFVSAYSVRIDQSAGDGWMNVAVKHNVTAASEPASWSPSWSGTYWYQAVALALRSGNGSYALQNGVSNTGTTDDGASHTTASVTVGVESQVITACLVSNDDGESWPLTTTLNGFTERVNALVQADESGLWVGNIAVASGASGGADLSQAGANEDWRSWTRSFVDGIELILPPSRVVYSRDLTQKRIYSRQLSETV